MVTKKHRRLHREFRDGDHVTFTRAGQKRTGVVLEANVPPNGLKIEAENGTVYRVSKTRVQLL